MAKYETDTIPRLLFDESFYDDETMNLIGGDGFTVEITAPEIDQRTLREIIYSDWIVVEAGPLNSEMMLLVLRLERHAAERVEQA